MRFPTKLSLLHVEKSQISQPFLIGEMLQCLSHLHGPSLVSLQCVHASCIEKPRAESGTPCTSSAVLSRGEGSLSPTHCDNTSSCSPEYH